MKLLLLAVITAAGLFAEDKPAVPESLKTDYWKAVASLQFYRSELLESLSPEQITLKKQMEESQRKTAQATDSLRKACQAQTPGSDVDEQGNCVKPRAK